MIKNILFDLGGVFIRLTREECVRRFISLGVHDANILLDPYCQSGIFLDLELGKYDKESFAVLLSQKYKKDISVEEVSWALQGFVENVEEEKFRFISNDLPKDVRLLLVSNSNEYVFQWANSPKFLSSQKTLKEHFERTYASFELGMCKPERALFEHIIHDSHIIPSETLFIDDGPKNTLQARALGFVTYTPDNGEDWTALLRKMF